MENRTAKVQWGVLSTANIGVKRVIPAILAGARGSVAAIASRDSARAAGVAAKLGIARSFGSYQALLDDPDIEAVYNPLPNHLHVEWTVKALDAGKHVLCEKPIALNADEAGAIVAARDRSGKRVLEAFMVRFHPQWQRIRALLDAGRIGAVRAIQAAFVFPVFDPNNVRNRADIGGGALYDVGCYPIVTARYVFRSEPERVIALIRSPARSRPVDQRFAGLSRRSSCGIQQRTAIGALPAHGDSRRGGAHRGPAAVHAAERPRLPHRHRLRQEPGRQFGGIRAISSGGSVRAAMRPCGGGIPRRGGAGVSDRRCHRQHAGDRRAVSFREFRALGEALSAAAQGRGHENGSGGRAVPVWILGMTNALFGMYGGILVITVPQLLSARHVPEAQIAALTAVAISPGFWTFVASPVLDVRFSRRWYSAVTALLAAA